MNDWPASNRLPIITGSDGQPYIGVNAVVMLLRALASACHANADEPDVDLHVAAAALEMEADALDVRAIAHTA